MVKILDLDKIFDKYIEKYVLDNIGKVKPEEIENKISDLYTEFGNVKNAELDNYTPNEYYKTFSLQELLECLNNHVDKNVPVSDFLCEAIISKKQDYKYILSELNRDANEQYLVYLFNILQDIDVKIPHSRCIEFICDGYSESLSELSTEYLSMNANDVKDMILDNYSDCSSEAKEKFAEILSNASIDDRITEILSTALKENKKSIPLYASFITKYGDDRLLDTLKEVIEDEKISYADFEELRFAIESLGGTYDKNRDFTHDKSYKMIKGVKNKKVL